MSRSHHITLKSIVKNYTKKEIDEQEDDPNSDIRKWGRKNRVKKAVTKARKAAKAK